LVITPWTVVCPSSHAIRWHEAVAVGRVHDQLAEHRVVVAAHLAAGGDAEVGPHVVGLRDVQRGDRAGLGQLGDGVLGVEPDLERVPVGADVVLVDAEGFAGGDPELQLDEVEPGDRAR
jgi:hypothetical protein